VHNPGEHNPILWFGFSVVLSANSRIVYSNIVFSSLERGELMGASLSQQFYLLSTKKHFPETPGLTCV
jgi:hypothetical protein